MSTQTESIVAERPATPAVWHVGERSNPRSALPILNEHDVTVGFTFRAPIARLLAAAPQLLWLARQVTDADPDDCRLDHRGLCQAHWVSNPCEVAVARRLVAEIGLEL